MVVKTKSPFADALATFAGWGDAQILAKEHEESPEATQKLVGSGPWLFVNTQAPVETNYRRNPNYFRKPYPYFDEVKLLGTADYAKQVADFSAKQVHVTYGQPEENRDQIRRARPDALMFPYQFPAHTVGMRVDQAPMNDKRVRQALSMAIDRKAIREAVSKGEGEPDQALTVANQAWPFRKVSELGAAAKHWNYDPQAAKQLFSAAGVSGPIQGEMQHWNAAVIGQPFVDSAVLVQTQWRSGGFAQLRSVELTFAQATMAYGSGNFDGFAFFPGAIGFGVTPGKAIRDAFWSPASGPNPPTNWGHVNNPELSALLDKQLTQLDKNERMQTLRRVEDILADEMYRIPLSTYTSTYFVDPSLKNAVMPLFAYNGNIGFFLKYWWFA